MSKADKAAPGAVSPDQLPAGLILERLACMATELVALRNADTAGLPLPGRFTAEDGVTLLALRPRVWLRLAQPGMTVDDHGLRAIDQTDGVALFRLEGARARDVLMRCCRLDLRDCHFGVGSVATTAFAHITATLLCDALGQDYRLLVPASLAVSFVGQLSRTAAHLTD